jgi:hypothetical protein
MESPFFYNLLFFFHVSLPIKVVEWLPLLGLGFLISVVLDNIHVFGHLMRKDKAEAQEHYCDSHPMTKPALACRFLAPSHCNPLSVLQFDNNSL